MKKDLTIIGAGLSGIYAAFLLQKEYRVTILEARDRPGGRIHTLDGHDMGPSWVWQHHTHMLNLIADLKLELFAQYTQGMALYDQNDTPQRFMPTPQAPSARLKGGMATLIERLIASTESLKIIYSCQVTAILQQEKQLLIQTAEGKTFLSETAVLALPPKVAATIRFEPPLPDEKLQKMRSIPTWMAHTAKCVVTFKRPFWKASGLSGFVFSNQGPLFEIHDASTDQEAALFGFFHSRTAADKEAVIAQLVRLLGPEAKEFHNYYCSDWRTDPYTAGPGDGSPLREHPQYGYECDHFDTRLFCIGTESSSIEGGYLEGALISAAALARRILEKSSL